VVVHARTRWVLTAACAAVAALVLVRQHFAVRGIVVAAALAVPIVVIQRMRLAADEDGVTVVNLLRRRRVPWWEIDDFRLGHVGLSTCLDVCKRDGSRVHAWVVTLTGAAAFEPARVEAIRDELLAMLRSAPVREELQQV
jgi:hypothetical protein